MTKEHKAPGQVDHHNFDGINAHKRMCGAVDPGKLESFK